jgi:hypothetical protein
MSDTGGVAVVVVR